MDSDATAPSTPTSAMTTGTHDAILNALAFVRLGSTLLLPVSYVRDFARQNTISGSSTNTATNSHVSVLWILMGGWNHQ